MKMDVSDIKDEFGRTLMLRGVNLGGSSKVPFTPNGATYRQGNFYDHRNVSFVSRPFPLAEADEHFGRLRSWGFTFLRFLVTWEAIEHAGPGIYDQEYLDYVKAILEEAAKHEINVFIDPHQDVWSRFSGGDGAPGWTFDLIGMDITKFQETGAAFTHQDHGDPLPQMIWSTNATKLAAATMFTLFFGGGDFARFTKIEGESTQEYLQRHFIASIQKLAEYVSDLPNVVGFDSMNEPVEGWIGLKDLNKRITTVEKGFIPTPFQAMQLGSGIGIKLEKWERGVLGPRVVRREMANPDGVSVWKDGYDPIWQRNGVWKMIDKKPVLLQPNHFGYRQGQIVDFNRDYYVPFNNRFAEAVRKIQPASMIFVEKGFGPDGPAWGSEDAQDIVYAPHWYDPVVLVMKSFNSWINYDRRKKQFLVGSRRIASSFREQLSRPLVHAREKMGNVPVLIGEVGIAYDLDNKSAYGDGDFSAQEKAFNRTLIALESNLHHFTLWNYTADNTNARGDQWNDEDLSIFSRDQQVDPGDINSGGRALAAVLR
ncbi:MAG: cellulase family glycosylhydrolase, partial [Anaerolineales bacterium]|nr:cellulase family glycosylhydrolase [Anaerolineales bacterium]